MNTTLLTSTLCIVCISNRSFDSIFKSKHLLWPQFSANAHNHTYGWVYSICQPVRNTYTQTTSSQHSTIYKWWKFVTPLIMVIFFSGNSTTMYIYVHKLALWIPNLLRCCVQCLQLSSQEFSTSWTKKDRKKTCAYVSRGIRTTDPFSPQKHIYIIWIHVSDGHSEYI